MHNVYVTNNYQTKKKKKNQDENKIFCLQNRAFTAFLRRKKKSISSRTISTHASWFLSEKNSIIFDCIEFVALLQFKMHVFKSFLPFKRSFFVPTILKLKISASKMKFKLQVLFFGDTTGFQIKRRISS